MQCPTVIPCIRKILNNYGRDWLARVEKGEQLMDIGYSGNVVWKERPDD